MTNRYFLSADYDGCFDRYCLEETSQQHNPEDASQQHDNLPIANYLIKEFQKYEKVRILCGSNRQDFKTDLYNEGNNKNGSIVEAYPSLADYLAKKTGREVVFDPFLLADLWNQVEPGTSFKEALQLRSLLSEHAEHLLHYSTRPENKGKGSLKYLFLKEIAANLGYQFYEKRIVPDRAKGLLLYMQMHYIARIFPNDAIVFEFVDDAKDILKELQKFYVDFPMLIPANVTLKLTYYKDNPAKAEEPRVLEMIEGKGFVCQDLYKRASWLVEEINKVSAADVGFEGLAFNFGITNKEYFPFAKKSAELDEMLQSYTFTAESSCGLHSFWQNVLWSERNESAEKRKRFDEHCGLVTSSPSI